jgi:cytochrome c
MSAHIKRTWLGGGFVALCAAYVVINTAYMLYNGPRVLDAAPLDGKLRGRLVAETCVACHYLNQTKTLLGPSLQNVVGRKVASVAGYNYSAALSAKAGQVWTSDKLIEFVQNPQAVAPGSKMVVNGVTPQDARDVIEYLESL